MTEGTIVFVLVAIAVVFVVRHVLKNDDESSGCSGCDSRPKR